MKRLRSLVTKRNVLLFVSFITYNLILISIGIFLFFTLVPSDLGEKVTVDLRNKISFKKIPVNYVKGKTAQPEHLHIDIKHKHYQKLAYIRALSLEKGILYDTMINKIPATIRYKNEVYRVGLSLKGRLKDHWKDDEIWSLKVSVKDGKSIMGMKSFALQHPRTRSFNNEWVLHKLYEHVGIINLRYDFVSVDINGNGKHIYALEEGFERRLIEHNRLKEGPIFKFDKDFYWKRRIEKNSNKIGLAQSFWGANLVPMPKNKTMADSVQFGLFLKAKSLMDDFRHNRLTTSEVFDVPKLATYFAVMELFGYHHATYMDNIRFYYNPITALIEPIVHDNNNIKVLENNGLMGAQRKIGRDIQYRQPIGWFGDWEVTAWQEAVFKDPVFYKAYIKSLEKIAEKEFLDSFFTTTAAQFLEKQKTLHRDYPLYHFNPMPLLYRNQEYIRKMLHPGQIFHAHYKEDQISDQQIQLNITNNHCFPIQIHRAVMGDSLELKLATGGKEIIQANISSGAPPIQSIAFEVPENLRSGPSIIPDLMVYGSILGSENIFATKVAGSLTSYDELSKKSSNWYLSNLRQFTFLDIEETEKKILFKTGYHQVDKGLVIPQGYQVHIKEGTEINFIKGANLTSYSPLFMTGLKNRPIVFTSSDSSSDGIMVIKAEEESILQHVEFNGLSHLKGGKGPIKPAVTFYQSPVYIDHCFFGNIRGRSAALQIIRSTYLIDHTVFFKTDGNALSSQFSHGSIANSNFVKAEKDAIHALGSNLNLEKITIREGNANGISAAENTSIDARNLKIQLTDIGFVCRDRSDIQMDQIEVNNCRIAFSAFQKDHNYGPAEIKIKRHLKVTNTLEIKYLIEEGSSLTIANKPIMPSLSEKQNRLALNGIKQSISQ